jgi:hypothetical protein
MTGGEAVRGADDGGDGEASAEDSSEVDEQGRNEYEQVRSRPYATRHNPGCAVLLMHPYPASMQDGGHGACGAAGPAMYGSERPHTRTAFLERKPVFEAPAMRRAARKLSEAHATRLRSLLSFHSSRRHAPSSTSAPPLVQEHRTNTAVIAAALPDTKDDFLVGEDKELDGGGDCEGLQRRAAAASARIRIRIRIVTASRGRPLLEPSRLMGLYSKAQALCD